MNSLLSRLKQWIGGAYHWLWSDFLMRLEPFTYQFRRMCARYPWLWIALTTIPAIKIGLSVYQGHWFLVFTWFIVDIFLVWLAYHLGGYAMRVKIKNVKSWFLRRTK
jgi:hypothetical protein